MESVELVVHQRDYFVIKKGFSFQSLVIIVNFFFFPNQCFHKSRPLLEYEGDCENKMATKREQHASERDQNNENVCEVNIKARDQNNENVRNTSEARDQNNEDAYRTKTHSGGKNRKQMTYREALIGLDNSEPSSDF